MSAETFKVILETKREVAELRAAKQPAMQAAKATVVDDEEPKDAPTGNEWADLLARK